MWPFRRKKKHYAAGEEVQFLLDNGWKKVQSLWWHDGLQGFVSFRQAMMHGKVQYQAEQARERYRHKIHLFDPNSFIGRIIGVFRFVFRMK